MLKILNLGLLVLTAQRDRYIRNSRAPWLLTAELVDVGTLRLTLRCELQFRLSFSAVPQRESADISDPNELNATQKGLVARFQGVGADVSEEGYKMRCQTGVRVLAQTRPDAWKPQGRFPQVDNGNSVPYFEEA